MEAVAEFMRLRGAFGVAYTVALLDVGLEKIMLSSYTLDERSGRQNIELMVCDGLADGIIGKPD